MFPTNVYKVHLVDVNTNEVIETHTIKNGKGYSITVWAHANQKYTQEIEIRICQYSDKCEQCWESEFEDQGYNTEEDDFL